MAKRMIGEAEFSSITMGCMAVADSAVWGPQDEQETIRTMQTARDYGVESFDTAPMYGNGYSEQLLGKAFHGSDKVVIATKVPPEMMKKEDCIKACETSLKYLERDYIDLYQIHWPSSTVALEETMEAMLLLKRQGKVREIGVCNFGMEQLKEALNYEDLRSNQLMYNLFFRAPEFEMIPALQQNGLAMLTYSSIAQGLLTGKYATLDQVPVTLRRTRHYPASMNPHSPHSEAGCREEVEKAILNLRTFCNDHGYNMAQAAIAWLLSKPAVTTVIAGARTIHQLETNAASVQIKLSPEEIAELDQLSQEIKMKMGANLDAWRSTDDEANRRIR